MPVLRWKDSGDMDIMKPQKTKEKGRNDLPRNHGIIEDTEDKKIIKNFPIFPFFVVRISASPW